jgi:hypothetical protein
MVEVGTSARRGRHAVLLTLAFAALVVAAATVALRQPTTPGSPSVGEPPVLAGQQLWGSCSGGFYARLGDTIVLTSSGHCAAEGTIAFDADGATVRGVFGPPARARTCPYPNHKCAASDMNYLVVAEDQIPWGRLNVINLGAGGHHTIAAETGPLACEDIREGDHVEFNGRNDHRTGAVAEKGEYLRDNDGDYFPCMVAARIPVATGDSGGAVLVRGIPGGVASRSFDGWLGFTPLAEGLVQLGLDLCTTPNCDLAPPSTGPDG